MVAKRKSSLSSGSYFKNGWRRSTCLEKKVDIAEVEADVEKSENEKIVQPFRLWRPHSSPNAYTLECELTRTASEMEVCLFGWKYLKVFGIVDMKYPTLRRFHYVGTNH